MTRLILPEPEIAAGGGAPPREERPRLRRVRLRSPRAWWRDPWRKPHVLAAATWAYIAWSLVPVFIAIQFSFNDGRSRSTWQGFSMRWYWGDPTRSVWHDPSLRQAMFNSLVL